MNRYLWLLASFGLTNANQQCKPVEYSSRGSYLKGHVLSSGNAANIGECLVKCSREPQCTSINFRFKDMFCELNDANRHTHPWNYGSREGHAYNDFPNRTFQYRSCADIKDVNKEAKNGYYWIAVKNKTVQVYCDMDNHGGGWTLVVSVSSSNNNHLIQEERNCFNSSMCVPYENVANIPSRKMKDEDIWGIASTHDGVFRVDVFRHSLNFSVFYAIPSGAKYFNSACNGAERGLCPRIIISYSYPYQWESNCNGTDKGYPLYSNCHTVFDGHDNGECGHLWLSSENYPKRALYGFCHGNGIFNGANHQNLPGRLFVK